MSIITNLQQAGALKFGTATLLAKKYSPELLTGAGVVGIVATAVLAAKATLKLEPIVDDIKHNLDVVNDNHADNPSALQRQRTKELVKGTARVTKLYGPTLVVGGTTALAFIAANGILRKRVVALGAAYTVLEDQFGKYRDRIREELGEGREDDIYHARVSVKEKDENGKTVEVKKIDVNGLSSYARCFDETNKHFKSIPEINFFFLKAQQNFANDLLHARGYVFLNDVYEALGLPRSQAGQVVGWKLSKESDNFVDFNIFSQSGKAHDFVNGLEDAIWLDFNVDGPILDAI